MGESRALNQTNQKGTNLFSRPLLMSNTFLWSSSVSELNASRGDVLNFVDESQVSSQLAPLTCSSYELQFIGGCRHLNKRFIAFTAFGIRRPWLHKAGIFVQPCGFRKIA
jgi:hypothetical protein